VKQVGDALDTAARVRLVVARLQRRIRNQEMGGLSLTEVSCLSVIARRGPVAINEIASSEHLSFPAATKTIARLEAAKIVKRLADPTDRRVSLITITPTGDRVLEEIRQRRNAFLQERLAGLTRSELDALEAALPLLERMAEDE